ncbi:MAG TPA: c-type cytochrome [Candidatus Binataceae bacterium]|nr:c-type cytochrome [Candidatus Binataceae bacterium]
MKNFASRADNRGFFHPFNCASSMSRRLAENVIRKHAIVLLLLLLTSFLLPARSIAAGANEPKAQELAEQQDCFSCHAINHEVVGPAWLKVAQTYSGQPQAVAILTFKVINGGVGHWGTVPMPAHPKLSEADATEIVKWILAMRGEVKEPPAKIYQYRDASGKAVTVDFRVFNDNKHQVTDDIFSGYEKYDSYCYRCHGPDAEGGEYAPDLKKSLANGMTKREFFIVAMEGRKDKGMPEWAGFFTADEMQQIYEYVKARQIGLIGPGRPPSASD